MQPAADFSPQQPTPVIKLDAAKLLGGLPDGSAKTAAGTKVGMRAKAAVVITLNPAKILGGLPDGSVKVAAGSKAFGMRAPRAAG